MNGSLYRTGFLLPTMGKEITNFTMHYELCPMHLKRTCESSITKLIEIVKNHNEKDKNIVE